MKKVIFILGIMVGIIITSGVVYAITIYASDITYDNTRSGLKDANNNDVDNVKDAIDALYSKAISGGGSAPIICTFDSNDFVAQANKDNYYSIGTKYNCTVKENTTYGFYVLTNHTNTVDLIMEHNITELVGSTRTMDWQHAMDYFRKGEGASLNWTVPVSLPEAQAIADAVGNTSWKTTEKDSNGWFCLGLHDKNSCSNNQAWDKATDAGITAIAPYKLYKRMHSFRM